METETWFWIAGHLIQAVIFGFVFRKAGFSGWLGLLMAIPIVNLGTLGWFATATWPLEMGYHGNTTSTNVDAAWELKMALRKVATLEREGKLDEAISQLEAFAQKLGQENPITSQIRERIQQLQGKR